MVDLLAAELAQLGCEEITPGYRVVFFTTDIEGFYRVHLWSRLASRFYLVLKEISANTATIIFDKAKRIQYHQYFTADTPIKIQINSAEADPKVPVHLMGSKLREAIADSFLHYTGKTATTQAYDAQLTLFGFYQKNKIMLSIDTSLKSHHKRAYRKEGHPAPLKETLAAALLQLCEYDGKTAFYDPMCGSGTIAIEAAQSAMHKAPLIHRKKGEFGFEHMAFFDNKIWKRVQDEARQSQHEPPAKIYASDIDRMFVSIAQESALAARVEKYIDFRQSDFFTTTKPEDSGLLICNLPYGLRLDEQLLTEEYLAEFGQHLKKNYQGWRCGILMPKAAPHKAIGMKARLRKELANGSVEVNFFIYDIFAAREV